MYYNGETIMDFSASFELNRCVSPKNIDFRERYSRVKKTPSE